MRTPFLPNRKDIKKNVVKKRQVDIIEKKTYLCKMKTENKTLMKTEKQTKGIAGEELAVNHLLGKGYRIFERNWRCGHLEVDIIAGIGDYLVIVEVKTRKNSRNGAPEDFVVRQKQRNLIRAANYYISFKGIRKEVRFDVVSVLLGEGVEEVRHIEDAFKPVW